MTKQRPKPLCGPLGDTTRLEMLYQVSRAASTSLNPAQVYDQVASTLSVGGGYPVVTVFVKAGDGFSQIAAIGLEEGHQVNPFVGIHGRVIRSGIPEFVRQVSQDPDHVAAREDITSVICVPVRVAGQTVGILGIESTADRPLTDEDFQLVSALAEQISLVVSNSLLHQEVEESRAEEIHRQATLLGSVREAIVATDLEGIVTYWNRGAEKLFGWKATEMLAKPVTERLPASKRRPFQGRMLDAGQGHSFFGEYEDVTRNGDTVWVEARISPLRNRQGQPVGIITVFRDITDRKRAEEERAEQQRRLRILLDTTPDVVIFKDRNHVHLACSETRRKQTNRTMEEMIGITDFDLFPPDQARRFLEEEKRVMEAKQPLTAEHLIETQDGKRWFESIKTPILDSQGGVAGILCSERDITKRVQAEEALRESQRVLLTLMSNLPGMAYRSRNDKDWTMEFVSEGCADLLGYRPSDVVLNNRVSYAQLINPDDRETVWDSVQAAIEQNRPFQLTYRLETATGEQKWVWEQGRGILSADGDLLHLEGFITDITDRIEAEEQVRASLEEKEVLLQELHHRVKNNLQVVSSLLALQCDYVTEPEILAMFQESRDRVRSMALVHEKLYQSQDLVRIDPAEYVESVVTQLFRSHGAAARGIHHTVETGDVALNLGSAMPCGLIINELVSNSLKHAFPPGQGGEIYVGLHETDRHETMLVVRDDGTGFPNSLDFQKAKSLGLQLVAMLVRQLEGRIEMNTREGTEFTVTFSD